MRGPSSEEEKTRLTIVYNVYCESCLVTRNIFSNSENGGIGGVRVQSGVEGAVRCILSVGRRVRRAQNTARRQGRCAVV
jgi:hypothetical protein